jgi:DNA-binding LytR/AlgR family response regulator
MITAIAIDDEPEAIEIIKRHASKLSDLDIVNQFYKPGIAIEYLRNNRVDLIFLDVNMPEMSGIELLRSLKALPFVIFTTAYQQYALESYQFEAIDYLLKPIDLDSFQNAINRVRKAISKAQNIKLPDDTLFYIKDGFKIIKIFYNDILVLKGCGNYVEFITATHKYVSRITINQLMAKLPPHKFIRVHHSYIVNVEQIDKIENNHINLADYKISIGDIYRKDFLEKLKERMI